MLGSQLYAQPEFKLSFSESAKFSDESILRILGEYYWEYKSIWSIDSLLVIIFTKVQALNSRQSDTFT